MGDDENDIRQIMHSLGRIEGDVASVKDTLPRFEKALLKERGDIDIHDKRLDALEQFQARAMGIVATIGAVVGAAAGYITDWIFGK